jgi:hypothetical protein
VLSGRRKGESLNLARLPDTTPGAKQVIFHDPLADMADVEARHHPGRTARRAPRRFGSKMMASVSQADTRAAAKAEVSRDLARLIAEHASRTAGSGEANAVPSGSMSR